MNKSKKLKLLDSSLREGEQAVGVCFSVAEKIEFAKKLRDFGVDIIEIGHPGISEVEEEVCRKIGELVTGVELLVHARACEDDVIAARNSKATWVGIWASYNDLGLQTKFNNKSRAWIKEQVQSAIHLAKKEGLKVRFTIEDASRTEWFLIEELGSIAVEAGADRISLADTVGAWHPSECYKLVEKAVAKFACEIEVHLHNDLGLAQANAISAFEAGASIIDVSVLGIGERAGICDLFSMAAALEKFYDRRGYDFNQAAELTEWMSRLAHLVPEPHHPIVGRNVFTHVSKYHIKAVNHNPAAYEFLNPEHFGSKRKNVLNTLERDDQRRFLNTLQVKRPFLKSATELQHHREGVGSRWVLMDYRIDARTPLYMIERIFNRDYSEEYQAHVDPHKHYCDSVFVFTGNNPDGSGLTVSVTFGEGDKQETQIIESPASILIPAHILHEYAYIKGTGRFLNLVLAQNYNTSLVN